MATPATVYGARLKGWWFENTTGSPVTTWTAETGPNLTAAAGHEPTTATTPGGKKALVFSEVGQKSVSTSSFSVTGTAFQVAFGFFVNSVPNGDVAEVLSIWNPGFTFAIDFALFGDATGVQLTVSSLGPYMGSTGYLAAGWHVAVLTVTTAGATTLTIDGVTAGTSSGNTGIATATLFGIGDAQSSRTATGVVSVCSPCLATDTSNFTAGDLTAITAALQAYVNAAAAGGNSSRLNLGMGLGL